MTLGTFRPMRSEEGGGGGAPNPGAGGGGDNATIQQMRTALQTAQNDLQALKTSLETVTQERDAKDGELKEFMQRDMTEMQKLQTNFEKANKELLELRPLKDEHAEFSKTFEGLYAKELESVPEDKREAAKSLTSVGSPALRYQNLVSLAKDFIPSGNGAPNPTSPPGKPGAPGTPPGKDYDFKEARTRGWGETLQNAGAK